MNERQRIRERLPEREKRRHDYEWNELRAVRWAEEARLFKEAPRVIKYDSVPWEQVHQSYHKVFTGDNLPDNARKLRRSPIFTMSARMLIIEQGRKNGNHRHYFEALFYIDEGKGYGIHDGHRSEWAQGDLLVVPANCTHQHFCDEGPAVMFYILGDVAPQVGLGGIEQVELNPNFRLPEGAKPLYDDRGFVAGYRRKDGQDILFREYAVGEGMVRAQEVLPGTHAVTDPYEYYVRVHEDEEFWRHTIPHVIRPGEWHDTRNGRIMWFTHPQMETAIRTYECYMQELPPGGRSGKHRHVGEEIHYIVDGKGYEVIDGQRWDWEDKDVVAIPINSTHQSFNSDPDRPARFLAVRSYLYDFMGFGGIQHLEDASS